jgi:hypothetical protein
MIQDINIIITYNQSMEIYYEYKKCKLIFCLRTIFGVKVSDQIATRNSSTFSRHKRTSDLD